MRRLTTTKARSQAQEQHVAKVYGGVVSPSSGGAITDSGDVRTADLELFECKQTGDPGKPAKSISVTVAVLEKLADEGWERGLNPVLHLRIHNPDSVLSDRDGNIDLVVRFEDDDLNRGPWHPSF